jgi:hypothetical protein
MPLSSVVGAQSIVKPGVCTSSTRPASPYVGQCIYETDTLLAKVWTGSSWADYPPGKADLSYVNTQDATKLTASTAVTSNRNVVINGNMAIWQRGTSSTGLSPYYSAADRWQGFRSAGVAGSSYYQITVGGVVAPANFAIRPQRDSGNTATNSIILAQSFETINIIPLRGKTLTLSFYARCGANYSATSSVLYGTVAQGTGTDGSPANGFTSQTNYLSGSATLTTSYQRFSFTGSAALASNIGQLSVAFYMDPTGTAGSNDWFEVTGVQLEASPVATPFEVEDFGTTLAKCQRYYESGQSASFYQMVVNGTWVPWTERLVHYKVRKRSTGAVSVTVTGSDNAAAGNGTVPSSNVDSFTHRQTVNNGSFPYCAYSLVYTVNSEL